MTRSTVWYRLPEACGKPRLYRTVAMLGAALFAVPSLLALIFRHAAAHQLATLAYNTWANDPMGARIIAGLEPARRAALPGRIHTSVAALLPYLCLVGIVAAIGVVIVTIFFGRFLGRAFSIEESDLSAHPAPPPGWSDLLVFAAGMGAHWHYLRESFNTDEAASMTHALSRWWAPMDTRFGWQIHIGGELLARVGFALFGIHDWASRAPLAISSSLGLVLVARWLKQRHGWPVAILTVGFLCALPLWAEQATLARGYGLLFLAGALAIPALWDVLDGTAHSAALGRLFLASLLGFLAHFFFLFLALTMIGLLLVEFRRRPRPTLAAAITWLLLGLIPAGLLYLPGLPATLYQSRTTGRLPSRVVLDRFIEALGFDLGPPHSRIVCAIVLLLLGIGLSMLAKRERARVLVLLSVTLGLPLLMRPVFFYPRFFIDLLPLLFPVVIPIAALLPKRPVVSIAVAGLVWALPRPWTEPPLTDLRGACEALRASLHPGETAYADRFYVQAGFYLHGIPIEYVPADREVPRSARLLLHGHDIHDPEPRVPGFHVARRFPGRDHELLIYESD